MHTVFVYGSLKRGFGNHGLLVDSTFVADAVSVDRFRMWGFAFPYVERSALGLPVAGELFEVTDDTLDDLDRLEGHPRHYRRELLRFVADDGQPRTAWIYIAVGNTSHAQPEDERVSHAGGVLRWTAEPLMTEKQLFVEAGWQCPECYGVRISNRRTRHDPQPIGFQCEECGCQWSATCV